MFILIPIVIISFCSSYLQINDDVAIYLQILLYTIIGITLFISVCVYRKVKNDINLQDCNSLCIEINRLVDKLDGTSDKKIISGLEQKIKLLEEEKESKQKNKTTK